MEHKSIYKKHLYNLTEERTKSVGAADRLHYGGSRGKWYSRLKICQATLRPCSTTSKACSLVNGSSNRIGHKNGRCSTGRSALCSPCADASPPEGGGRARSRWADEAGEVMSIIVTDVGAERGVDAPDPPAASSESGESGAES